MTRNGSDAVEIPEAPKAGAFPTRFVLGVVVLAGSWLAAWIIRRRRIHTVDVTSPDPFGDAVLREG